MSAPKHFFLVFRSLFFSSSNFPQHHWLLSLEIRQTEKLDAYKRGDDTSRCQYWIEYSIDPRVSIIACAKDRWPPWPMLPPPSWLSYTLHSLYIVHSTLSLCTVTTHTVPVCICTSIGFAQEDMHNFAQFSFTGMLSMSTCVQRLTVQWYNVPCAQFCMNRADGSLVTLLLHLHSLLPPLEHILILVLIVAA